MVVFGDKNTAKIKGICAKEEANITNIEPIRYFQNLFSFLIACSINIGKSFSMVGSNVLILVELQNKILRKNFLKINI